MLTVTVAEPDLLESCVEVAVMVAVPVVEGVKTPEVLTVPMLVGLRDHVTPLLNAPVPLTLEVQVEVWVVVIEEGEQVTDTEVIVTAVVTVTEAEPDFVVSSADVAVMVAVPALLGVKTPELLTEPMLVGLTDHVTAEL